MFTLIYIFYNEHVFNFGIKMNFDEFLRGHKVTLSCKGVEDFQNFGNFPGFLKTFGEALERFGKFNKKMFCHFASLVCMYM